MATGKRGIFLSGKMGIFNLLIMSVLQVQLRQIPIPFQRFGGDLSGGLAGFFGGLGFGVGVKKKTRQKWGFSR